MEPSHHALYVREAGVAEDIADGSVALVVTSPPYPMIRMWDACFTSADPSVGRSLRKGDGDRAFELMHRQLDPVWQAMYRVLMPGGILCINIGDATRTIAGEFRLYPNHARILQSCLGCGFRNLPNILWRKPTNAPTKFMGSGMLPAGAYVTLEHEHILVFRKGNRRVFRPGLEQRTRRRSGYFWEERNRWFSDLWEIRGTDQGLAGIGGRTRSAAFPLEIAFRLVLMYSCAGDLVLDPFVGTGTTMLAAAACGRHSCGFELDRYVAGVLRRRFCGALELLNGRIQARINDHGGFVREKGEERLRYPNALLGTRVMTRQETDIAIDFVEGIRRDGRKGFIVTYSTGRMGPRV